MSLPLTVFACILAAAVALFLAFLLFCLACVAWFALRGYLEANEDPKLDEDGSVIMGKPLPRLGRRV